MHRLYWLLVSKVTGKSNVCTIKFYHYITFRLQREYHISIRIAYYASRWISYCSETPVRRPSTVGNLHAIYHTFCQVSKCVSECIICIFCHLNSALAPCFVSTYKFGRTSHIVCGIRVWGRRGDIAAVLSRTDIQHIIVELQLDIEIIRTCCITDEVVGVLSELLVLAVWVNSAHP